MSVRRAVAGLAGLVVAAAASGCGASAPAAEVTTPAPPAAAGAPSASSAAGTSAAGAPASSGESSATLRDFAIRNGPVRFPLPADLLISYQVDNPNNVTLVIDVSQGADTYRFLRAHLPAAGFAITADGQESLTFDGRGWSGAYTVSASVAALTLRKP